MRVTRFRKHWLFGQRIFSVTDLQCTEPIRGWLPRGCVIEVEQMNEREIDKNCYQDNDENSLVDKTSSLTTIANNERISNKILQLRSKWSKSSADFNGYH